MNAKPTGAHFDELRIWLGVALKAQAKKQELPPDTPPDFAAWIGHLFWLNACLSAHTMLCSQLLGDEAEGLRILDEVTQEAAQSLHRCPKCSQFTDGLNACEHCGKSFVQAATRKN